jgi:hypothetical protein
LWFEFSTAVKVEAAIFWVTTWWLEMHFNPEDGVSTASETLLSNHHTTWYNDPGNHDFNSNLVLFPNILIYPQFLRIY